ITPEVPDEPKGISTGTSEGASVTPEVPNVSKDISAVQEIDEDE
nr:hypothetical protein [Tanacetum cinerariifolium]